MMFQYDEEFYKYIEGTKMDEEIIMPLLLQWLSPNSVIDFGCAEGAWLGKALEYNGRIDVLGLDGDYVKKERLKIPKENFMAVDLRQSISLNQRFDLAISMEVAEHLEEEFADVFIDNITRTSDQVLFSAAVPGQGGVHHVNEQWQSYWIEKFEKRGYYFDDSVRNYFWKESKISSWRRQNLLFFAKEKRKIAPERQLTDVMHPDGAAIKQKYLKERNFLKYYIFHPEILQKLEQIIKEAAVQKRKIVIYPYGNNGRLCEMILCEKYGVTNYLIADNNIKNKEKRILTAEQLKELSHEISVIDTCSNPKVHGEALAELQKYVNSKYIYSAFENEGCKCDL